MCVLRLNGGEQPPQRVWFALGDSTVPLMSNVSGNGSMIGLGKHQSHGNVATRSVGVWA
jgi:hypothetical protein